LFREGSVEEKLLSEIAGCCLCAEVSADPFVPGYRHRCRNAEAAYRWKPDAVKLLLVGESPPKSGDYFYTNPTALFKAVAEALCPQIALTRPNGHEDVLSRLTALGVFLADMAKCAVNYPNLDALDREPYLCHCSEHFVEELNTLEPQAIVPALKRISVPLGYILSGTPWYPRLIWCPELSFPNFPARRREFIENLRRIADDLGIAWREPQP
jgi:hypothetical protein